MAPLPSEIDTPETRERVEAAFDASDQGAGYAGNDDVCGAVFEHGRWWVQATPSGRTWAVVDAAGGSSIDGFDFELVSEGEES